MASRLIEDLERHAEGGDADAQLALARQCEADGAHEKAAAWLRRAAAAGGLEAKTALARLLLTDAFPDPSEGVRLTMEAARAGSGEAMHLFSVLGASGRTGPPNWPIVLQLLQRAAELGYPLAQSELALLAGEPPLLEALSQGETQRPETWDRLRQAVDIAAWLAAPALRTVHRRPRIGVCETFASATVCKWLIERARPQLKPAQINDRYSGEAVYSQNRTNSFAHFDFVKTDVVMQLLRARMLNFIGTNGFALEGLSILHYEPGQEFLPHYDFFNEAVLESNAASAQYRQRAITILIYLNDGYEGGETEFPMIHWRYKGNIGDALLFWNVKETGEPDLSTLHAGTAPTRGEKWLLSQWVRGDVMRNHPIA
jgi:hypothetical protein